MQVHKPRLPAFRSRWYASIDAPEPNLQTAQHKVPFIGGSFFKLLAALLVVLVIGSLPASAATGAITVFAAASLSDAFTELGQKLERRTPPIHATFNFGGSQQLAAQIEQGATADVFASADPRSMTYLHERGLLAEPARDFARNRLVVIIPRANPGQIAALEDLARPGLKLVIGAAAVPVGRYSREVLGKLSGAANFGSDYAERVLRNVVSQEENVKGVVAKVQLGEADAGIVYRSDVTPTVAERVRVLEIPDAYNVIATYPIAILKGAANLAAARAVVELLLSREGQRLLSAHRLLPLDAP